MLLYVTRCWVMSWFLSVMEWFIWLKMFGMQQRVPEKFTMFPMLVVIHVFLTWLKIVYGWSCFLIKFQWTMSCSKYLSEQRELNIVVYGDIVYGWSFELKWQDPILCCRTHDNCLLRSIPDGLIPRREWVKGPDPLIIYELIKLIQLEVDSLFVGEESILLISGLIILSSLLRMEMK